MIKLQKNIENYTIHCITVPMGKDLNISIFGGDTPHIGAVALGIPRKSLEDPSKISSSVSILTITGHKEDEIAKRVAKAIASNLNRTVVVSCGIHIDNIKVNFLTFIDDAIDEFINELCLSLK